MISSQHGKKTVTQKGGCPHPSVRVSSRRHMSCLAVKNVVRLRWQNLSVFLSWKEMTEEGGGIFTYSWSFMLTVELLCLQSIEVSQRSPIVSKKLSPYNFPSPSTSGIVLAWRLVASALSLSTRRMAAVLPHKSWNATSHSLPRPSSPRLFGFPCFFRGTDLLAFLPSCPRVLRFGGEKNRCFFWGGGVRCL